jgi:hypothetical protein
MKKNGKTVNRFTKLIGVAAIVLATGCSETITKQDTGSNIIIPPTDTTKGVTQFTNTNPTNAQKTQSSAISNNAYSQLNSAMTSMKEDPEDFITNGNFEALRDSFKQALELDPTNAQANIGYAMASLMTIQTSPDVKKAIDSLSGTSSPKTVSQMARIAFAKGVTLSKTVATDPTVPSFLTISYVQGVIEAVVLPVLNDAVAAVNRMQSNTDFTYTFNVDGEQIKIDAAEVYVFESVLRFARASFGMMCAYNIDFYTSATNRTYSWVDDLENIENAGYRTLIKVSGDTLYRTSVEDYTAEDIYMFRLLKTNFERTDFLTLRSPYHAQIRSDLIAIPAKLKAAIQSVRSEQGVQSYDLLKPTDLDGIDDFFADAEDDLVEEGVSAALASKFATPETFLTFVTEVLSGPYTISETVDEIPFVLKINLTAFFSNPVQDIRTLLPKFRWLDEAAWKVSDSWGDPYGYTSTYPSDQIFVNENDTVIVASNRVDSIGTDWNGNRIYYLKTPYHTTMYADTNYSVEPITLIRDNGTTLNMDEDMELPYFNDYTFAGLFPDMNTRAKWLTFIRQWEPEVN